MSLYHLHPNDPDDPDDDINREPELDIPVFDESHLDLSQVVDLGDYDFNDSEETFND